jgi:plasmid replication initiation protein
MTLVVMSKPGSSIVLNVIKSTGAVEISEPTGQLTLADRRLFNFLLAQAHGNIGKVQHHTTHLSSIREFAAEARSGVEEAGNRRLKESITRLQRTLVQFNYLDSDKGAVWQSSQLLGEFTLVERTGELTYSFPQQLAERLIEPALYSYISLRVVYQFESKYALILYEILKRYSDRDALQPYWAVKTSELRDLLGCRDKLADWKDFRRRALDPALDEIGQLSEFTVELDDIRQGGGRGGGRVVGATFRVRRKDRTQAEEAIRELEKPKVQRRGERKVKAEAAMVARAQRFLETADPSTRMRWAARAQTVGVTVPSSSREDLAKWVPAIARIICEEEGFR